MLCTDARQRLHMAKAMLLTDRARWLCEVGVMWMGCIRTRTSGEDLARCSAMPRQSCGACMPCKPVQGWHMSRKCFTRAMMPCMAALNNSIVALSHKTRARLKIGLAIGNLASSPIICGAYATDQTSEHMLRTAWTLVLATMHQQRNLYSDTAALLRYSCGDPAPCGAKMPSNCRTHLGTCRMYTL